MPNIYAGLIYYNDTPELIERCLKSCERAGLDGIVAIDGAFKEFPRKPHERIYSTDGSTRVAKKYATKWVSAPGRPWESQMEKRTAYIKALNPGDYFLVIDADEEIISDSPIDKSCLQHDYLSICMEHEPVADEVKIPDWAPIRVYRVYEDLEYRNRHCYLYRTSKITNPNDPVSGMYLDVHSCENFVKTKDGEYLTLVHRPGLRSKERLEQDGGFMRERSEKRWYNDKLLRYQEAMKDKIINPPQDATGTNRWVKVCFEGNFLYNGWLTDFAFKGKTFRIPYWRFMELVQIHGAKNWRLMK